MLVHPNKRQLKRECTVSLKKAQFVGKLVLCRSHIYARPLQKMTNQSDSSKVEVVGKKNFCFFQISMSVKTESLKRLKAVHPLLCALSLSLDCLPVRIALSLRWNTDRSGLICVTFQKTIADDADFLQQSRQYVRLPVQTPLRRYFKCQVLGMRKSTSQTGRQHVAAPKR